MTRAEWERKHRQHHPYICPACKRPRSTGVGRCTGCANARHNRRVGKRRAA